ncbi:hypothetical protein [Paenibacillus sp. R14(2021)]|uniref:hypothetical protein n=1 Tax=Paenibacillus sp. R14(2021) TaxID=2859228 RepID=UPI001C6152F5|nr:hypothetical protein [Paenibacillus sp. R14(2021)]
MQREQGNQQKQDFPGGLAKPAHRALANAGLSSLADVSRMSEHDFKKLHGIGPNALEKIRQAMKAKGLSFSEQ